jgi:hypothetical protein
MANHRRSDWSDVEAYFARMGVADGAAIHHTASVPQGDGYDPAYLRRIEHGELAAGYNALAYHTMWFDDGDSAESRPYGSMGAATGGHNGHTIAHCAVGYFHPPYNHVPSDAMCIAIANEIRWTRENGFMTPDGPVLPHREWTQGTQWATACCGDEFIGKVAWIDEMSRIGAGPPAPTPTPGRTGNMWAILMLFPHDGSATYIAGLDNTIWVDVHGPQRAYGFPLDQLNYIGWDVSQVPFTSVLSQTHASKVEWIRGQFPSFQNV